jgi:hypothetical protein
MLIVAQYVWQHWGHTPPSSCLWGKFLCDALQHLSVVEDREYSKLVHRSSI